MRITTLVTGLSLAVMLSACGAPDYGYYDSNGNFIPPANATSEAARRHAPDSSKSLPARNYDNTSNVIVVPSNVDYRYDRRGYYDYYGNYVTVDTRVSVPNDMFPPRGMCRVWLPNRAPEYQPRIESCDNIQYRIPAGAYVIYGG